MSDEQVERVAKAIAVTSGWKESAWPSYADHASAAIAAMQPTPQEGVDNCPGYSPDIQAMGDCRHCGHTAESHTALRAITGEARHD